MYVFLLYKYFRLARNKIFENNKNKCCPAAQQLFANAQQ